MSNISARIASVNSDRRNPDIERTAKELSGRQRFLNRISKQHWSYEQKALAIVASDKRISSNAVRVFAIRQFYADFGKGTNSKPSKETITDITGMSIRNVNRADNELKNAGYAVSTRRKQESAVFDLISPVETQRLIFELLIVSDFCQEVPSAAFLNSQEVPNPAIKKCHGRHSTSTLLPRERKELEITEEKISGPGFTVDLKSVDIAANLAGCSIKRAKMIAEICARDWLANEVVPASPMAAIKKAIANDGQNDLKKARSGYSWPLNEAMAISERWNGRKPEPRECCDAISN